MARLEDITLRTPALGMADDALLGAPGAGSELFGAISGAELENAMKELQQKGLAASTPSALLPMPDLDFDRNFETQPLVPFDAGTPLMPAAPLSPLAPLVDQDMPLDLDMGLAQDDIDFSADRIPVAGAETVVGEQVVLEAVGGEQDAALGDAALVGMDSVAKRRRRGFFQYDEVTEIPKDMYQGYVNDRSHITKKNMLDYTILLPHYAPHLPNFTTTFTEVCPELSEMLRWGSEVALKRRRLSQIAEGLGGGEFSGAQPAEMPLRPSPQESPFSPLLQPIPPSRQGLRSPEDAASSVPGSVVAGNPFSPPAELPTEQMLLANAPTSMDAVVTANMDEEDQAGNTEARVGYSGRTEKMHRFLAKEFKHTRSGALSYEKLCKAQGAGRRELIAGCFFELLVLKSNGVIGLKQDAPQSDIQISKAKLWAK